MINCETLWEIFKRQGITYFTGVPDSTFKEWMSFLEEKHGIEITNRIVAIERDAVGWAAGYHAATGEIGVVYMQNSGLGNVVNPITSLTDPEVYNIPLLLMIGWRGELGEKDEPQHKKMGRITEPLLDVLEIKYSILPDTAEEAEKLIKESAEYIRKTGRPYALIIRSGTLEEYKSHAKESCNYEMTREEAIKIIIDEMNESDVVVSTTGKTSRELFELREKEKSGHDRDFLMVGSMGLASSFGAEIALQKPEKRVFIFDGDGAAIMSEGVFSTIGFYSPENFYHVIFDNGSYDSTGGQPTTSSIVDFEKVALANGYKTASTVKTEQELRTYVRKTETEKGPWLIVVKVKKGARKDLGRPTSSPVENKQKFMKFLCQEEERRKI